jgi:hypothetical protein
MPTIPAAPGGEGFAHGTPVASSGTSSTVAGVRLLKNYAPLPRWLRLEKKLQSQLKFPGSTGGVVDRAE